MEAWAFSAALASISMQDHANEMQLATMLLSRRIESPGKVVCGGIDFCVWLSRSRLLQAWGSLWW